VNARYLGQPEWRFRQRLRCSQSRKMYPQSSRTHCLNLRLYVRAMRLANAFPKTKEDSRTQVGRRCAVVDWASKSFLPARRAKEGRKALACLFRVSSGSCSTAWASALCPTPRYGDAGPQHSGHVARSGPGHPQPVRLALQISSARTHHAPQAPRASFGKGATRSPGKGHHPGHWEMAGIC